jgi:hypothetical protein
MDVLSNYKVRFFLNGEDKMIKCIEHSISGFIYSGCSRVSEANQVLNGINAVMNGSSPFFSTTTQGLVMIVVTESLTKFYIEYEYDEDPNMEAIYQLPTAHFKVILEAWRNYLQS